jgi:aspartate 1-decarboxylase
MLIEMFKSKIHRATVTDADLNYEGSCEIDPDLMEAAEILEGEKVQVVNVANGARFETYTIAGKRGSRTVCLNGPAARQGQVGDKIIIITYVHLTPEEARAHKPVILHVNDKNEPVK